MSIDPPPWAFNGGANPPPYPGQQPSYPPGFGPPPGYGWTPPPEKPRPKKRWYGVGIGLLVIGLVLGGGLFAGALFSVVGKRPGAEHTFASGGSTTVHIDGGATKVIYIENADEAGRHHVHCDVDSASAQRARLQRFSGMRLDHWEAFFTIDAIDSGDYTVTCMGAGSDTFGVGDKPNMGAFAGGILGAFAGAGMVVAGVVTIVVTAVLRRRRSATPQGPQGFTAPW